MTLDRDVIEVTSAPFMAAEVLTVTLRSTVALQPSEYPTVTLRAPTGMLLDTMQTLKITSWSFQLDNGVYVAERAIAVTGPALMPMLLPGPWPISITGERVTGAPHSVLVNVKESTTQSFEGVYEGRVTARSSIAAGVTAIPVTAWVSGTFILLFDSYHVLSPDGVVGFSLNGSATTVNWVKGDAGTQMTASISSIIAPTHAPSTGELTGGRFIVKLPLYAAQPGYEPYVEFDYTLRRIAGLTAPTCSSNQDCSINSTAQCEEGLGRCVPGPEWRVVGNTTNSLMSERAEQWISSSQWMLANNTPGLFGIPTVPGTDGIGRSLMCLPPLGSSVTLGLANLSPGFVHGIDQETGTTSGELSDSTPPSLLPISYCMQPVPLGLNRDNALRGNPAQYAFELHADNLLEQCLYEANLKPPPVSSSLGANAVNWFGSKQQCISLARLYPMIEWLTGWNGPTTHRGGLEARSLHAVLSRWLAATSFTGNQATQQAVHDGASSLQIPSTLESDVDVAVALIRSQLAHLLRKRSSDALLTLPRDVLRRPDYREVRPVSYYTFDLEDTNGTKAIDVAGEAHGVLQHTGYSRPGTTCTSQLQPCAQGISTTQRMTIPRGPAELYGDFQVAFTYTIPMPWEIQMAMPLPILEYGDSANVIYSVFMRDWGDGPKLYVYHGARGSYPSPPPISASLIHGQTYHVIVSRRAQYSISSQGVVTWASIYKGMVNGAVAMSNSSTPLVTSLSSNASGTFDIRGYVNDLAFWDEATSSPSLFIPASDNYYFDSITSTLGIPSDANHEQPIGIAAVVLETASSYLSTTAAATKLDAGDAYADCVSGTESASSSRRQTIERAGQALRYSWAAEAMTSRMHDRAGKRGCGTNQACPVGMTCQIDGTGESICLGSGSAMQVPWTERYEQALEEVDAARVGLVQALEPIARCSDPYGISRGAVPLFFGDPLGTSSRFFAASDYLVNTWASPAVSRAQSSLDQARDAWLNKRNSEIQELQTSQQQQARLEQLELGYAQPIIELCGLSGVDPLQVLNMVDAGTINPWNCFRHETSFCGTEEGSTSAQCYRGEMGKAALTIISAERAMDVAETSKNVAQLLYENQDELCSQIHVNNGTDALALSKHRDRMRVLREAQLAGSSIMGYLTGIVSQGAGNPAALFEIHTRNLSAEYDLAMQAAADDYQQFVHAASSRDEELACIHESEQLRLRIQVEESVIQQRLVDVQIASLQLQNYLDRIRQLALESRTVLAREQLRTVPSVAHHYWLDPKIDRYRRDFEWARRLTMLAVRAVEYEFQQSIPAAADVLRAGSVTDLQLVIAELEQEQASRTINGRRPQDTSIVISLRDDVLGMADHHNLSATALPAGERTWSALTRFGKGLESKLFAVYDDDGNYLGQGIPFSLRETGALKYRCAERLWRVNATIQGDIPNMSAPSVPVMLLKRNTFASQWCDGRGNGTAMQQGTVFPSANLFDLQGGATNDDEADASTAALLMPWFNVIRSEFYKEQYVDGSSEEFAGRGLYGDYVLLFPESGLLDWTNGYKCDDFPLSRIEDVLLRFDLISVDNLQL